MKFVSILGCLAVAGAQTWQEYAYGRDTIILAICFTDKNTGYFPFEDADGTMGMKVTTDGGVTWTASPATKFSSLLMDGSCSGKNGVVGGMMDTQFSNDKWATWTASNGSKFISQSAGTIFGKQDNTFFGLAGNDVFGHNGVAISLDGGNTFKFNNVSQLVTDSRYGAFPSRNVWYLSAGMWGSDATPKDESVAHELSAHINVAKNGKKTFSKRVLAPTPGWIAQIVTTKDGGKTWTSSFVDEGNMYFNGISCGSETSCCASADGVAGSYIYCTSDGKTWTQKLFNAGSANSLMAMDAVSATEYWAGGGEMDRNFLGVFYHSTDGGNTWTNQTIKNIYVDDIDFADATHAWASSLDKDDQSGLARFGY
jgi:photosystem II stability/assembly factor-like uncharacterized protein